VGDSGAAFFREPRNGERYIGIVFWCFGYTHGRAPGERGAVGSEGEGNHSCVGR